MKTYFTIAYKLKERDSYDAGSLRDFSLTEGSYVGNILASSREDAVSKLKDDFSMLTVEVESVSEMKSMTDEEYENG